MFHRVNTRAIGQMSLRRKPGSLSAEGESGAICKGKHSFHMTVSFPVNINCGIYLLSHLSFANSNQRRFVFCLQPL